MFPPCAILTLGRRQMFTFSVCFPETKMNIKDQCKQIQCISSYIFSYSSSCLNVGEGGDYAVNKWLKFN